MKQKIFIGLLITTFLTTQMLSYSKQANAAANGSVVINEIAWAGSADNANDEWIELYNTTNQPINLTGWVINDDQGSSLYNLSGTIGPNGYYLIEDSENSVTPQTANAIINVSLANSGDSLILSDNNNQVVDAVNSSGGAWFSGNSTTKATMERINSAISGDDATNWATNKQSSGSKSSGGSLILGTPGGVNSVSQINQGNSSQKIFLESSTPDVNGNRVITGKIENAQALVSYGLEIQYDPTLLSFNSATKGNFLSQSENKETSFQAGLENNVEGKLLLAEAITEINKTGTSGNGELFSLSFKVLKNTEAALTFGQTSFAAGINGDIATTTEGLTLPGTPIETSPITNLQAVEGAERYSIKLSWDAPATGADSYKVYRRSPLADWVLLGEIDNQNTFTDSDGTENGGKIIPLIDYHYQVVAIKNGTASNSVEIAAHDSRGLKGDSNRSDRVDGRDLENLAIHFGETTVSNSFEALIDTNYDGEIDGSDLIDIGLNFAKTSTSSSAK